MATTSVEQLLSNLELTNPDRRALKLAIRQAIELERAA
jgi:hypothetical protein